MAWLGVEGTGLFGMLFKGGWEWLYAESNTGSKGILKGRKLTVEVGVSKEPLLVFVAAWESGRLKICYCD